MQPNYCPNAALATNCIANHISLKETLRNRFYELYKLYNFGSP